MSDHNQTAPQKPVQIHPVAELLEARWQMGAMRIRNLTLANENFELKTRLKELETENEILLRNDKREK